MKKSIIIVFILLFSINTFSQKDILYISDVSYQTELKGTFFFLIKSTDKRFNHDLYMFEVESSDLPYTVSIYKQGKEIDIANVHLTELSYFSNKSSNDTHIELSLTKRIKIVMKIPDHIKNREKFNFEYMVWDVRYSGTVKDVLPTSF